MRRSTILHSLPIFAMCVCLAMPTHAKGQPQRVRLVRDGDVRVSTNGAMGLQWWKYDPEKGIAEWFQPHAWRVSHRWELPRVLKIGTEVRFSIDAESFVTAGIHTHVGIRGQDVEFDRFPAELEVTAPGIGRKNGTASFRVKSLPLPYRIGTTIPVWVWAGFDSPVYYYTYRIKACK